MASPSPVPLPRSLVVKKGSKMRGRSSGGMPLPVSLTVKRTPSVIFSNFEVAGKVSFSVFFRLEAECSSCGHRVARIHRQIQQDLLHLIAVRHDPAEISTGPNVNMNVLTDEAGKKIGYFHNGVVKVEDRRLEDLLAAESQQLAHEGLRAVRALHDFRYFKPLIHDRHIWSVFFKLDAGKFISKGRPDGIQVSLEVRLGTRAGVLHQTDNRFFLSFRPIISTLDVGTNRRQNHGTEGAEEKNK